MFEDILGSVTPQLDFTALTVDWPVIYAWYVNNAHNLFPIFLSMVAVAVLAALVWQPTKQYFRRRWRGFKTMRQHAKQRAREDQIVSDFITDGLEMLEEVQLISRSSKNRWYRQLGRKWGITDFVPKKMRLSKGRIDRLKEEARVRFDALKAARAPQFVDKDTTIAGTLPTGYQLPPQPELPDAAPANTAAAIVARIKGRKQAAAA